MFLDIAFGVLIGAYTAEISPSALGPLIAVGILASILPDIDFIFHYAHIRYPHVRVYALFSHRGVIHTPLFLIVFILLLSALQVPLTFILMIMVGFVFHLVHDVFVLGRGVMVLYPFSRKRLKLFPDNGRGGYLSERILWWNECETPVYTHGGRASIHSESWIADWYFRMNWFVVTETLLGIGCSVGAYMLVM